MSQHKSFPNLITISALLVTSAAPSSAIPRSGEESIAQSPISNLVRILPLGQSPISNHLFVPNHGQWPAEVRFQLRGLGGTWWFTDEAVWVTIVQGTEGTEGTQGTQGTENSELRTLSPCHLVTLSPCHLHGVALRLTFPGLSSAARLVPLDPLPTRHNYLLGNDATKWRSNVPTFGRLRWEGVAPGVDIEFQQDGFMVHGPSSMVHLHVDGATALRVDTTGHLVAETTIGSIPLPFQAVALDGNTVSLSSPSPCPTGMLRNHLVTLSPCHPVTLSPTDDPTNLLYSTFLGAGTIDDGYAIAVNAAGEAYITGDTYSPGFPTTPGAFDRTYNGGDQDTFVTKLNSSGSELVYSTFIGGSSGDRSYGIAVDDTGAAYIAGWTYSSDYPVTPGAFSTHLAGDRDTFITKLNADGTSLVYSTFLGGAGSDAGSGLALALDGSVLVAGNTDSEDFPTTTGAFDTSFNGGLHPADGYLARLNATGSALVFSTFLGGNSSDTGQMVGLSPDGGVIVTGWTNSADFPVTPDAYDPSYNGSTDIYVTKLNAEGSTLIFSTYLGGSSQDQSHWLAVGADGTAYVAGQSLSSDYPTTPGAYDVSYNGGYSFGDAVVTALNPIGNALVYSTYLGGSDDDYGYGLALGADSSVYVSGYTDSQNFPTLASSFDPTFNGVIDAFAIRLSPNGAELQYSTYLGGSIEDCDFYSRCTAIAVGEDHQAYITGVTYSHDFPATPDAYDTTYNGGRDIYVTKLNMSQAVLHVASIDPRYRPVGDGYRIGVEVAIVDAANHPVVGAEVALTIDLPTGRQVEVTGRTRAEGHFSPTGTTRLHGTYIFTVTGVRKAGYVYDPSQNVETSDSVTIR